MRRRIQCRRKLLSRARRSRSHRAGDASRPRVHAWSCRHRSSDAGRGGQERSNDPVKVFSRREDLTGCTYVPRRCSQEAAQPDPEARWRAEQLELERSYLFVFRPLLGMPYRSLRCVIVFAFISHVSVAAVVSLYEG